MSNNTLPVTATIGAFVLFAVVTVSISIVSDNRYDANVLTTAIEHNCNVQVISNAKMTITCPDPKIEKELMDMANE